MEQYLALAHQAPGVVKLEIEGIVNFEIKSQFMRELKEDTFSRNNNEDAHNHVDRILSIVDRLTPGAVNTWDLLKNAFIQRYCPPSKTAKQLEDIHNFKQEDDKSLYQAWERSIGGINNTNGLAAIVRCQICKGPYLDKECPLNEEVKKVEEVKYKEFGDPAPFNGINGAKFHVGPPGTTIGAPSSSTRECKVVYANQETPINPTSSSASVNVMPRRIFEYLKLTNLRKTNMLVEMANMTKKAPLGIIENILVQIDRFRFPSDFVIIDKTLNENIILGRPFLATIHAEIDVFDKEIALGVGNDKIIFYMEKKDHNFTILTTKILMVKSIRKGEPNCPPGDPSLKSFKSDNLHEIDQLADEYELRIGKKGQILEEVWENYKKVQCKDDTWWYDYWFEDDEKQEIRANKYDPPKVNLETFKVTRYSFDTSNNFIFVSKESKDSLSLGRKNISGFREMIRIEFNEDAHDEM
uniref:Retrotransposon gag domain-containing protein n=1 Tax=Tanacetum cinerariifolium TaxID=118510 RepID=A0A6L2NTF8_TANCI|nr:hypothetical protein [Tanacetum cinerariifolium]